MTQYLNFAQIQSWINLKFLLVSTCLVCLNYNHTALAEPSINSVITPSGAENDSVLASKVTNKIQQIKVLGNTVFSKLKLEAIIQPFIGRQLRFEELLAIRTAITDLYTQNGYTTSGAFLPPQDISGGIITIQVVEGEIEHVEIHGLKRLKAEYVRSRINLAAKKPINLRRLEKALQLLQIDPLFTSVQAELKSGTTPGRSILSLTLKEAPAVKWDFTLENKDSPSIGSILGSTSLSYQNILGLGDRFLATIGYTAGSNNYDLSYSIPVTVQDGTVTFHYMDGNSRIIEQPFSPLDILGNTETFSIGFRQPLVHTNNNEFALSLTADRRESQTFLLNNIPFSFSIGPDNGKSKVTVLRFSQDWISRNPYRILSARSQFSWGLDALDATVNNTGVDGRFFSWLGQLQWVQSLGKDIVGVVRIASQLTPDSLLPLEQFSIGGVDTLRGYRQNQFVADNGFTASAEMRFPLINQPHGFGTMQISPFVDVGKVWNNNTIQVDDQVFASAGLGLRWQYTKKFSGRLDWGIPLTPIKKEGDSLQDNGIYFSLNYQLF